MTENTSLNYERIYEYRFQGISLEKKEGVWQEIAPFICRKMGNPQSLIDPAAGGLEFLRFAPATEKWAVDLQTPEIDFQNQGIRFRQGDIFKTDLPENHFEGAFLSNFLEHLGSSEEIHRLFNILRKTLRPQGVIAIMGPNFKYCSREYFDCADHRLALTHISVAEMLYGSGFSIQEVIPKFLPFSFRGRIPAFPALTRLYLNFPPAWRFLGKQFLILGRAPTT